MKEIILLFVAASYAAGPNPGPTATPGQGVRGSVHDMNVVGGVAPDEQGRICVFCHTPHHPIQDQASEHLPLWSHSLTSRIKYRQYESPTFDAGRVDIIDPLIGPSRMCMSCHDGAIAVDAHYGIPGAAVFTEDRFVDGTPRVVIGENYSLANDHPIGFDINRSIEGDAGIFYDVARSRVYEGTDKEIGKYLYLGRYMTCVTCHDVHNRDNFVHTGPISKNYLLYGDQNRSRLCISCHDK